MGKERVILHCDLNNFYASVECRYDPRLWEVPMAVGGSEENRHGIVLAKNELAKQFGIKTAETLWQARQKCPELVVVPPHYERYYEVSRAARAIYARYTDRIEPFGIDECWLDMTGSTLLFGSGREIVERLRREVREELGVTISVGVSFNKVFAKLGSDYKKPDATTVIAPSNWQSIVWPLPVSDLLFVGRASQRILHRYGIETIGQLAHADRAMLEEVMGKQGAQLHDYAWGRGDNPVRPAGDRPPPKSIGNGMTFRHNLTNWDEIRSGLDLLCDSVAVRLRQAQRKGTRIQVTIRDPQFQTITRQSPLPLPTNLARELTAGAVALVQKHWIVGKPIRMLTVTALNLVPEWDAVEQLDLFQPNRSAQREKLEHLERAVDHIRSKYGSDAILLGSVAAQSELYGRSDGESDELEPENEE